MILQPCIVASAAPSVVLSMEIKVSGGVHNSCHCWDTEGGQVSKYTA